MKEENDLPVGTGFTEEQQDMLFSEHEYNKVMVSHHNETEDSLENLKSIQNRIEIKAQDIKRKISREEGMNMLDNLFNI